MKGVNKVLCPESCVYRSRYAPFCGYCTKAILEEREADHERESAKSKDIEQAGILWSRHGEEDNSADLS